MLMVVLGHTMTGCTDGAYDSFLYNVIWSIQMPLFILISGFVTKYSRGIESGKKLAKYIVRRSLSYLLPWIVWTILIRGIVFSKKQFLDFKWLLWHMDSGYWFLVTIWTISMVFGFSAFFAHIIAHKRDIEPLILFLFYITGMGGLVAIGHCVGYSFLSIKLTIYYMPFFFVGYLIGHYSDRVMKIQRICIISECLIAVSLVAWISILSLYNLFSMADSGKTVVLRGFCSFTGCLAVCGLIYRAFCEQNAPKKCKTLLCWCGSHSLEIYVTHYLFLNIFKSERLPSVWSIEGVALTIINFAFALLAVAVIIGLFDYNRVLKFLLYGKLPHNQSKSSDQVTG